MFDNREENSNIYYTEAVKDAVINNPENRKIKNRMFLILNLSLSIVFLGGLAFFVYNFLDSGGRSQKTKVMGITHIAEDNKQEKVITQSDIDYAIEIEKLDNPMDSEYNKQLSKYLENKKRDMEKSN